MNNITATRALLRQSVKLSQAGRIYNVARHSTRPITCQSCGQQRPVLVPRTPAPAPASPRRQDAEPRALFHTTPIAHKKKKTERGGGGGKDADDDRKGSSSSSAGAESETIDIMDFTDVTQRLRKHAEYFKDTLKKLQTGGRFTPEVLGALQITLDRKAGTTYPLRELAQVVPRGPRAVSLIAHDKAYVKPIMSAIQSSDAFNQQPQRSSTDEDDLELKLKVEPEPAADLVKRAKAIAHEWRERVRFVRQARSNMLNDLRQKHLVLPDAKRAAAKELEKVIKAALAEVDGAEKAAVDAAESKGK